MSQNLFKIYGGRTSLLQWETKQKLIVLDDSIKEVHFSNRNMNHAIVKDVLKDQDGLCVCEIPDALLMLPKNLVASAYITDDSGITRFRSVKFAVMQRPIPSDYIVSEDFYFEDFDGRLKTLEGVIKDSCLIQRFNTLAEAEQWAQEFKDSGAVITVNIDSRWVAHMVEDDYSITPILGGGGSGEGADTAYVDSQIKNAIAALKLQETYDAKGSAQAVQEKIPTKVSQLENDKEYLSTDNIEPLIITTISDNQVDNGFNEIINAINAGREALFNAGDGLIVPLMAVDETERVALFGFSAVRSVLIYTVRGNTFTSELIEIDIPTKVSQLENDKEYLTAGDIEPMEPIFVHMGVNHSVDVSSDEIVEASNAGLQVFLVLGDMYVPLSLIAEGIPYFATVLDDTTLTMYIDGNTLYFPSTYRYPVIHSEETVKVGQTLVVKSVDADGMPTKWKPADIFQAQIITWEADD